MLLLLGGVMASPLIGAEFSAKISDGLGRPLSGVTFEVEIPRKGDDGKIQKTEWLKLTSNSNGVVKGSYDEEVLPDGKSMSVYVSKDGYESYSTDLKTEYLLRRTFSPKDVRRISRLKGEARRSELKELLAGDFQAEDQRERESLNESVFYYGSRFRPALQSLVGDKDVGTAASELLAFIGLPDDLRLIVKNAPAPQGELFRDRWVYMVVSALVEPTSKEEWAFLKRCALGEYQDGWVDAGAIKTLRLIASSQACDILEEVRKQKPVRSRSVENALDYIKSNPASLASTNLAEVARRVAEAIKVGEWQGAKEPRFNEDDDMALIDCEFIAGRDLLIYTATFHKVGDSWKFRGARETMQALLARPPDRQAFIGAWQGFSESHLEFARIELNDNGNGMLAVSYLPNSPPENYRILKWSLRKAKVDIEVEPVGPESEPVSLQNVVRGIASIECELRGRGWSRKLVLFNEAELQRRTDAAKQSLKQLQDSGPK